MSVTIIKVKPKGIGASLSRNGPIFLILLLSHPSKLIVFGRANLSRLEICTHIRHL